MWEGGEGETRRIWRESGIEGGKGGEEGGCNARVRSWTAGTSGLVGSDAILRGLGGEGRGEERYVSVFPHWWYIRCKIRRVTTCARRAIYPMHRVKCLVAYRPPRFATLYARGW